MESSEFNVEMLNDLIKQSSAKYECNDECMRKRTSEKLKSRYYDAIDTIQMAPQRATDAFRKYVLFTQGEQAYDTLNTKRLAEQSAKKSNKIQLTFDTSANMVSETADVYTSMFTNFKHVVELYRRLVAKNKLAKKQISSQTSTALTNDRMVYYSDQQIAKLEQYYSFFKSIYWIMIVVFVVLSIRQIKSHTPGNKQGLVKSVVIGLGLVSYPWVSMWLFVIIQRFLLWLYSWVPNNIYYT